ncbi:MAG: SMI1/KNR4 family protein [Planctomycetota bacterium]
MEPKKPIRESDVAPPFSHLGEPGWAEAVKVLLATYDVPLPTPVSSVALANREAELGIKLPQALCTFLTKVGPLDLDGLRIHPPEEITFCDRVWFRDHLTPEHQAWLPQLLAVAGTGSDNFIALDLESRRCGVLSHDPPGLWKPLPDFDTLIKVTLMRLPAGYYGWPDQEVADLVDAAVTDLVGYCF